MTLKEAIDQALTKQVPDSTTMKANTEFLEKINVPKEQQDKMNAVIDGMKKQQVAKAAQEEEEKKQKPQPQPVGEAPATAQTSSTAGTAQTSNTSNTAQIKNR